MPRNKEINKVLVIGSGPIIIGQAAEFDYSGTQACKALREEGLYVVLVNSNPATIMTDRDTADKVYIEPLDLGTVKKILEREMPDGVLASMGGQTALNLAVALHEDGILQKLGIKILGTSFNSIRLAEDRELFKNKMLQIGEGVAESVIATSLKDAYAFAEKAGYPVIVRPAYTLGGSGGGIADDRQALTEICRKGLKLSMISQVLLEKSVAGWKEIEYEVMRDNAGNCITVCNMENFDPVGIHTGDSIVVAPSQTLSDKEYHMLRNASIKIITELGICGGCNIQFALHPKSNEYVVIEVNPRVSRSSALASKATGYPIARAAAKIAIGLNLDEISNLVTGTTSMMFEPSLDYIVTKIPRWPFDKFHKADRSLGTQMKATGEVMAIGRTFEESLLKAIDSLDVKFNYQLGLSLFDDKTDEELTEHMKHPTDERIFSIFKALQRDIPAEYIHDITKIDMFFLNKLKNIVNVAEKIRNAGIAWLDHELYGEAKKIGFGDSYIANLVNAAPEKIYAMRDKSPVTPVYKMVDTCAAEFAAATPYYYSTYDSEDDLIRDDNRKVLVIGSGPIRIGQGIEFDYCSVHSVKTLHSLGYESAIVNNNPETVSTDFDTSDKLFFEPLTKECVLDIIREEKPEGVIVQFGGQTAINLAAAIAAEDVKILGTGVSGIDDAENRDSFLRILEKIGIPAPEGHTAHSFEDARKIALKIGYPVLVRPSYVLGGRAMQIVYDEKTLREYISMASDISRKHPILVDKYINGKEIEVDGISDGETVFIPGIMEHIERAGVHSGDSIAVYPTRSLTDDTIRQVADYSSRLALAFGTIGLFNIQFVQDSEGKIFVIEVNPRASRTIPFMSKITGVPMVEIATRAIMGEKLKDMGYPDGLLRPGKYFAVKAPVFSFSKLATLDTYLGPEMKSTGEVMGVSTDYHEALLKALTASGLKIPASGSVLLSLEDTSEEESKRIASRVKSLGFDVHAVKETEGKVSEYCSGTVADTELIEYIKDDRTVMVINLPTNSLHHDALGFRLRRTCIEFGVPCITSIDTAEAIFEIIENYDRIKDTQICALDEYSVYTGEVI